MRPQYNYNYNYGVTPSSVQKPHSSNPYKKNYEQTHQNQSTAHYFIPSQSPVMYYPINQDQLPAFKTVHSATESSSSFYVNASQKDFQPKYNEITSKSPKFTNNPQQALNSQQQTLNLSQQNLNNLSQQNLYNPSQKTFNNPSQLSNNTNITHEFDHSVSPGRKTDDSTERYLDWLQGAFAEFERTGNVQVLKQLNEQNAQQTKKLHQKLLAEKQNISSNSSIPRQLSLTPGSSPRPKTPLHSHRLSKLQQQLSILQQQSSKLSTSISHETQLNQQLQSQLQHEIQSRQNCLLNQSHVREDNHVKQMQESIDELEQEIKTLQRKNDQLAKGITPLPFFKEWNIMFQEAKGATKLNLKLKHEIAKRQTLIKNLTNQDPSNNSDARSVRKMPSQSGQKPSNFKKQPKPSTPTPISKPQSQNANKFNQKPDSSRSNDVVIRHLSHSNRFSQSKKSTVNNSVQKTKERKQSHDQKPHPDGTEWKNMAFAQNLKNIGLNFIGKDVYK